LQKRPEKLPPSVVYRPVIEQECDTYPSLPGGCDLCRRGGGDCDGTMTAASLPLNQSRCAQKIP